MDNHDEESPPAFTPVLIDTGNTRAFQQKRVAVKDPENTASRQAQTQIPKRLEALYILFADTRDSGGAVLTREELDINPRTKDLPKSEKNLLVKYWPRFQSNLETARELRKLREEETQIALKAEKGAVRIRRKRGMNEMALPEQLESTARVFHEQVFKSSLALAATDIDEIHSDPLSRAFYKLRVTYVKDFIWIARNLTDLSERIREADDGTGGRAQLTDETREMLQKADALLLRKGVKTDGE